MLRREPIGVVGQITPWNYPLMMAIWKIGPALATGNVSVLKPSEQTPLTTLRMAELAAGILPPGVLNVVTGDGDPVGTGIVAHPRVRMVSLTGDVATGKEVAAAAAATLKHVHLELGGKAPVIVLDDADLARGRPGPAPRRLPQRRPGLHRGLARHRRPADLRARCSRRSSPPSSRSSSATPPRATTSRWARSISEAQRQRVLGFVDRAAAAAPAS